jgi:hypothetical protein
MFQQKTGQLDHMQVLLAASGLDEFYKYFDQAPGSAGIEGLSRGSWFIRPKETRVYGTCIYEGFHKWWYPNSWMVYSGKSH